MGNFLREMATYLIASNAEIAIYSEMSSYARLQSLNSDTKQTTGQINLTLAGLEVVEEAYTTYEFLAKSNKPQNRLQKYNIRDW